MQLDKFHKALEQIGRDAYDVLGGQFLKSECVKINLSETNAELNMHVLASSEKLEAFITQHLRKHRAKVAFGGYLEVRNIYRRSTYFAPINQEERNIHLGIDLWCAAKTPVFAPLDAEVHSFNNNTNHGDYGPTIILKHRIDNSSFYTLYGHLSLYSIANLTVGKIFKKGEQIGTLGAAKINGDYPPHLHFQIIKDIQDSTGDYPGVCSKQDLEFYKLNCPNPKFLL